MQATRSFEVYPYYTTFYFLFLCTASVLIRYSLLNLIYSRLGFPLVYCGNTLEFKFFDNCDLAIAIFSNIGNYREPPACIGS